MEKIAANAQLTPAHCQKIAAYGFSVGLASPSIGLPPATVKRLAQSFQSAMTKSAARHAELVAALTAHVSPA